MPVLLTPASWFHVPRVSVCPEVVAFWVTIKMEPHPVTLDLMGKERRRACHFTDKRLQTESRVHRIRTSATLSTQKREG